jgi:hypothetical protein
MQTEFMRRLQEAKKQGTRAPTIPSCPVPEIPRELGREGGRLVHRARQAACQGREGAPSPPEQVERN